VTDDSGDDGPLHDLLAVFERGELGDPLPLLAYIAGRSVSLAGDEVNAARRRAALLRAAAGGALRPVGIDDPATKLLARELHSAEHQAELAAGLERLVPLARDLPVVREGLVVLVGDLDLAWRLFMLGLLADELAGDERSNDEG